MCGSEGYHVYRGRPGLPGVCASTPTPESYRGGLTPFRLSDGRVRGGGVRGHDGAGGDDQRPERLACEIHGRWSERVAENRS